MGRTPSSAAGPLAGLFEFKFVFKEGPTLTS
jgi:hypothetical protein